MAMESRQRTNEQDPSFDEATGNEDFASLFEQSLEKNEIPFVSVSASGGARMHEGVFSLMQMARTVACRIALAKEGLPFMSVMTDPTTGGVAASFAFLGDVILAEPGALIGFAGPRVIEETVKQRLPEGFQRAEFLLAKGMIDGVVPRAELKKKVATFLYHLWPPAKAQWLKANGVVILDGDWARYLKGKKL